MTENAPSSQGTDRSKKPKLKPTTMLQNENNWLRQQLGRERENSKQRHTELIDLHRQEKEENHEQISKLTDVLIRAANSQLNRRKLTVKFSVKLPVKFFFSWFNISQEPLNSVLTSFGSVKTLQLYNYFQINIISEIYSMCK